MYVAQATLISFYTSDVNLFLQGKRIHAWQKNTINSEQIAQICVYK